MRPRFTVIDGSTLGMRNSFSSWSLPWGSVLM